MGLKKVTINEGPMDFARGAGGEIGRKVNNSRVVQGARDIYAAGQQASVAGELNNLVAQYAAILQKVGTLSGEPVQQPQRQEPTLQPAQQQQPQQQQQARAQGQPNAAAKGNPNDPNTWSLSPMVRRMRAGTGNFREFLEIIHDEQLDEGVLDFLGGMAKETGNKLRNTINQYAGRPSWVKDVVNAGRKASEQGNARKASAQVEALKARAQAVAKQIAALVGKLGPAGAQALQKACGRANIDPQQLVAAMQA